MNKIMKTLISVLFIVGLVLPTTVLGTLAADQSLVETDFSVTADEDVALSVATNNLGGNDIVYDLKIKGTSFGDVTIPEVSSSKYEFVSIPVKYLYSKLGMELDEQLTADVELIGKDAATQDVKLKGTLTVNVADGETELMDASEISFDIDVEDNELTFNDEIEFEVEIENLDSDNVVENAYVKVALFDKNDEKVEGWIESEDDGIRFEDDEEVMLDQVDFVKALNIPSHDDIEADTGYYVSFEVYGDYNGYHDHLLATENSNTFEVEKLEDHLTIESVSIEQQGNVLYTAITVENDGEENQKDVRARVQINGIDVKQTSNAVNVYEDDDATIYVPVVLPAFATGEYNVKVTVYNNDVSVTETVEDVELDGIMAPNTQPEGGVIIGVDTAVKTIPANGAVYAMTFTNNDAVARTFVLETAGAEWAQTSVNPTTVVVGAGSSEIASIFVAPNANELGTRQFTVFIKEGTQIVKTIGLTANVEGNSVTGNAGFDFEDVVDSGLKWVAAILVVVLIVLFVMWSWNKAEEEL